MIFLRGKYGQNKFALISPEDNDYIKQFKWYCNKGGYVYRYEKGGIIYLHREIMWRMNGDLRFEVDHIDRDKLNCCRWNLRPVTRQQNLRNRKFKSKSGFTGIYQKNNKWYVRITINKKTIYVGIFNDLCQAINARKKAEEIYWL